MRVILHKKTVLVLFASLSLAACSAGVSVRVADSEKKNTSSSLSQTHDTSDYYSVASNPAVGNVKKSGGTK